MEITNQQIAEKIRFFGQLLEILGEVPYKVRAYERASETVRRLEKSAASMSEDELVQLPAIGKNIAQKIAEYTATGSIMELEELQAKIPSNLVELLNLEGVGPKTVHTLWKKLGIDGIESLETAARGRRIRAVHGFGPKKEEEILHAIKNYRSRSERMTLIDADHIIDKLSHLMEAGTFIVAGSYRRCRSTIGDIDVISIDSPKRLNQVLRSGVEIIEEGDRRTSIRLMGKRVDIRFTKPELCGSMLIYLTGSKAFNIHLRSIAQTEGWKLNEYGIEDRSTGKMHTFSNEETMFDFLGMSFIPSELREDRGEIENALSHSLPVLIEKTDIRGDLHVHSRWSDGVFSIRELAAIGEDLGYEYIACTDHSHSLGVAGGLADSDIPAQQHEIELVNRESGCHILSGIEVDILSDGKLSVPNNLLSDLDFVVAAIHTGFKQDRDVLTRRIISAIQNDHVDVIAHPTGRLLGRRLSYELDMTRVIEAASETQTALEINASPYRLDLDDVHVKSAVEHNVKLAIGTDSHRREDFEMMKYGVGIARRGWGKKVDVINTQNLRDLLEWAS